MSREKNKKTFKDLRPLRKALRGHYQAVADMSEVTVSFVSHVLNGRNESDKVMNAAIQIKEQLAAKKSEQLEKALSGL